MPSLELGIGKGTDRPGNVPDPQVFMLVLKNKSSNANNNPMELNV